MSGYRAGDRVRTECDSYPGYAGTVRGARGKTVWVRLDAHPHMLMPFAPFELAPAGAR